MTSKNSAFLSCEPIPNVRVGIVGVGVRGLRAVDRFVHIKGSQITYLCDKNSETLNQSLAVIPSNYDKPFLTEDWKVLCQSDKVDLVYICTDWLSHSEIALFAMQCGKHTAVEVPAAMTVADCWKLVDTAEKEKRHCVILENCCYDAFELNILNMVEKGFFGDIIHADCGYIHDLRCLNFPPTPTSKKGMNRLKYSLNYNGNIYPTHGLGAVCLAMNINRGDKLTRLVSMSSRQQGLTEYAVERFGKESEEANRNYQLGDMNTTIISTEKGGTILLQHNSNNPRPYSRKYSLTGTKAFCQKYPTHQLFMDEASFSEKEVEETLEKYQHPFLQQYYKEAVNISGDHFFDFIMDKRLIYCLNNGLPTDLNVYDAVTWSSIIELTQLSVEKGNQPIEIPDFIR
ncbi:MAG: acetylgalactosaminidase [Paludibacter sp.]|nr:MAG: acetylgalactosaminidase [Paludibacter sp.]